MIYSIYPIESDAFQRKINDATLTLNQTSLVSLAAPLSETEFDLGTFWQEAMNYDEPFDMERPCYPLA